MKKHVNLFKKPGKNSLYELIRTRNHPNDLKAMAYWNDKYNKNAQYLDKKFVSEFPNDTEACLWELTLSDFLKNSPNIDLIEDKDFGRKNKSKPDFCFVADKRIFYLEATTFNPGQCATLDIELEAVLGSSCRIPREEYKEKVCGALKTKVERFKTGYQNIVTEDDGFLIAISAAPIGIHLNPDDPLLEAGCLYGLSERMYAPDTGDISITEQYTIPKKGTDEVIDTRYFVDEQFNFLSGVLFSRKLSVFFPKIKELEHRIPDFKSECTLYHNPIAKIRLPRESLPFENQFESKGTLGNILLTEFT